MPDIDQLGSWLTGQTAGLASAVADLDPDSTVPTCPEWTVRTLVGHLGQAHRWAAETVRGSPSPPPDPRVAEAVPPTEWAGWLAAGAAGLVAAVRAADGVVPTFVGPLPALFWLRRMVHDTAVHHADAVLTAGREFRVPAELAADTITEGLELISSPVTATVAPALAELGGTGQTLGFRPTDGERGWVARRTPDGVRWAREGGATWLGGAAALPGGGDGGGVVAPELADVVVAGPVNDLLLVFSRRRPPGGPVVVSGDTGLFEHWLERTRF
ncbi:uncharacterized protein (TIGR03083 family) [Crossiella equi]|uniref:Uncharacterized protein (TIGR03083 family) n=1 Tax=Crossiella equi TaxID=130796 RepID=A0ABS5AMU5_9PSEU|nr:maleylpyruvate isomerase family mycothiol-dependent enzyme [Crossiella equi]MBP2477900.1 uncharacterized protein (TIGR03083 family) [Crossiella equi]